MLCHRLYISIVFVDFFLQVVVHLFNTFTNRIPWRYYWSLMKMVKISMWRLTSYMRKYFAMY